MASALSARKHGSDTTDLQQEIALGVTGFLPVLLQRVLLFLEYSLTPLPSQPFDPDA
jgi:hypothetical protein